MNNFFDIPILLIIYKRKYTAQRAIHAIAEVHPKVLYIFQDGPKNNRDKKEILETRRAVLSQVNWNCKLKTSYHNKNLGLKNAIPNAVTWFFSEVKMGIVMEDDCLPDISFFGFCKEMLNKYKNDDKVMHIGGANFLPDKLQDFRKYYFSKYSHVWGWATWQRAWKKYNIEIPQSFNSVLRKEHLSFWERLYWKSIFQKTLEGKINTWDYQWTYSIWRNNGQCVVPGVNLVRNVGFNIQSTHFTTRNLSFKTRKLSRKPKLESNDNFDKFVGKYLFWRNPVYVLVISIASKFI